MATNTTNLVFLADDDSDDREFFEDACSQVDETVQCKTFAGGRPLMDHLRNDGNELPEILFLDINMPHKDGFACLQEIRGTERLKDLCVVLYSTSDYANEVRKGHKLGADGHLRKPFSFNELLKQLSSIFGNDLSDPCGRLGELDFLLRHKDMSKEI